MSFSEDVSLMNKRFDGFLNTPFLWTCSLTELSAYQTYGSNKIKLPKIETSPGIRLGKLVEEFVLHELNADDAVEVLVSNLPVFRDRITIGELDSLIRKGDKYIHLEIVYKFYLYDPTYKMELDKWIGPNRKDSFVFKLAKLRDKQLPLLRLPETGELLKNYQLDVSQFEQLVYFKAQLFVPYGRTEEKYELINNDCIKGFYIRMHELIKFENYTFHIPAKLDWLIDPHVAVDWLTFSEFKNSTSKLLEDHKSPLCWMMSPEGRFQKFFLVWWEA